MYAKILMPIDGSSCSEHVIGEGLELARNLDAAVTFLLVVEDPVVRIYGVPYGQQLHDDLLRAGEEALDAAAARARASNVPAKTLLVEDGRPVEAILDAEESHDLTIIGTHGLRGFQRIILGSVVDELVRSSKLPHLVIRCPEGGA